MINEVTYWNAFRGEDHDWASIKAEKETEEIGLLILFPKDKPFKDYKLFAYPHGSDMTKEFKGKSKIFPSDNHLSLASEVGLGPHRLEEVEMVGASIDDVRYEFKPC